MLAITEAIEARVLSVIMVIGLAMGAPNLKRIWNHEVAYFDHVPPWWLWGEIGWRMLARCVVLGWIVGFLLFAPAAFYAFLGDIQNDTAPLWFAIPSVAALLLGGLLLASVGFLSRPKWIIPPHLRSQPGALAEWRQARRDKQSRRD